MEEKDFKINQRSRKGGKRRNSFVVLLNCDYNVEVFDAKNASNAKCCYLYTVHWLYELQVFAPHSNRVCVCAGVSVSVSGVSVSLLA